MKEIPDFQLGDIVRMRKKHPCGSYHWRIKRLGADIKMECLTCKRVVMIARSEFERRLVGIENDFIDENKI